MDDEALNISIRKFLKMVGVGSQREIEQAWPRPWRPAPSPVRAAGAGHCRQR